MASSGGVELARLLAAEGVDTVFGIPDGTYVEFLRGLRDVGIRIVTPRHESSALHMAGAFARLTGRVGVAMASNGPGVANALPGVAVENAEGNRVLLVTSSRRTGIVRPDRGGTYQNFDQVGTIGAMARWSSSVPSLDRLAELTRRAFRESFSGRPGVVHLDVPEDIVNGKAKALAIEPPERYRPTAPLAPTAGLVERAARLLADAELPVIHAGGGVIHAQAFDALAAVAEALHAPVTTSWSGRGAIVETNQLVWPMTAIAANNQVRNEADVVLLLGSRLGETDWWGKAPNWREPSEQQAIQVDLDEAALGRNKPVDVAIQADVGAFLDQLAKQLVDLGRPPDSRRAKVASLAVKRDLELAKHRKALEDMSTPMVTAHLAARCGDVFGEDTVYVMDGGNTAVWGHFYHQVKTPNALLHTPHFGMLGAGVGQALGASEARPDTPVVCIIGDGAFGMHPQEVETAVRNGNHVVFLVVSDRQWGMVKMSQSMALKPVKTVVRKQLGTDETINTDLGDIAYDRMATSMGAHGERVSDPGELRAVLERCRDTPGCSVVHVDVDPKKHMWAPGLLHFKKMHQEPEG